MIQLQDINAGDTIQGMVQKINYNFDQIQANGGGPRGAQGERGERGEMGPRGARGLQGERGCAWFAMDGSRATPQTPMIEPQENDLGIDENGYVWIYVVDGGMSHWEVTDFNITSALDSPFAVRSSVGAIVEKSDFSEYYLTFGSTFNNITQRSIETKPSIVICNNTMGEAHPHTDGIEFYRDFVHTDYFSGRISVNYDGDRAILDIHSEGDTRLSSSDGADRNSLVVEGGRKLKWTPLAGSTGDSGVKPLLMGDNNGYISTWASDDQTKWKWGVKMEDYGLFKGNYFLPADIYNESEQALLLPYIGSQNAGIQGICMGNVFENTLYPGSIVLPESQDGKYLLSAMAGDSSNSSLMGVHSNGMTVGMFPNYNSPSQHGITSRNGLTIYDSQSAGGVISFGVYGSTPKSYIASNIENIYFGGSAGTASCYGYVPTTQDYKTNLPKGSQYGESPLITLTPSSNTAAKSRNQLKILGGKYGNAVSIAGGREYNAKLGGDVYISGGDVIGTNPEANISAYNDKLQYFPLYFGDVVIGINPDNHWNYYTESRGDVNDRGVNDPSGESTLDFYDINNFVVHSSSIWLDSDAQARALRSDYYKNSDHSYPSISTHKNLSFNVGGLCTLNHGKPLRLSQEDMYRYQLMSGKMSFIAEIYINSDGQVVYNMYSRKFRYSPLNRAFYSFVTTDWTKVGGVVQCSTRINNYYYDNGYYVLTSNTDILDKCPVVANNTVFTNIVPPVVDDYRISQGRGILKGVKANSFNGTGVFVSEHNASASVDNDNFFVQPTTVIFSGTEFKESGVYGPNSGFSNNRHNTDGKLKATNPLGSTTEWAQDYAGKDIIALSPGQPLYIMGSNEVSYIVPSYLANIDGNEVLHWVDRLYSSATLNYSYIIQPVFNQDEHMPFKRNFSKGEESDRIYSSGNDTRRVQNGNGGGGFTNPSNALWIEADQLKCSQM